MHIKMSLKINSYPVYIGTFVCGIYMNGRILLHVLFVQVMVTSLVGATMSMVNWVFPRMILKSLLLFLWICPTLMVTWSPWQQVEHSLHSQQVKD